MEHILIATEFAFTEKEKNRIAHISRGHEVLYKSRLEVTPEDMEKVSIILGNLSLRLFAHAPNLKWVQLATAGTDGYLKEGILPAQVTLTNASGAFGESIAEYVLGATLAMKNHFPAYLRQQKERQWAKITVSNLKNSTVLLLGLGDIGRETAKRMKAMGAYVIAVKRRPSPKPAYVDELYYQEDLDRLIPRADVFVLTIPMYEDVYHIIDQRRIGLMKADALFINIARGKLVDEKALAEALAQKKIGGAVLDVFATEPLGADSPLWDLENVIITPHNAGLFTSPMARERLGQIMIDNLERYFKGQELQNIVDKKTGYKI